MAWWFLSLIGASVAPAASLIEVFAAGDYGATCMQNRVTGYAVTRLGYAVTRFSWDYKELSGCAVTRQKVNRLLLKQHILIEAVLGNRPLYRGFVRAIAAIFSIDALDLILDKALERCHIFKGLVLPCLQ